MFAWLRPRLYVQITPRTVTIRVPHMGTTVSDAADIAITHHQGHRVIAAVGSAASALRGSANVQVISPFAHPCSIIDQFEEAEAMLRVLIKQVLGMRWIAMAPTVVIHPMGSPEGGFTQVELRALQAMAQRAGARKVYVWSGQTLSDEEVLAAPQASSKGTWHCGVA